MRMVIMLDAEADGRVIADVPAVPGVMAYGATRDDAVRAVKSLGLRVMADKVEHGEIGPNEETFSFTIVPKG